MYWQVVNFAEHKIKVWFQTKKNNNNTKQLNSAKFIFKYIS